MSTCQTAICDRPAPEATICTTCQSVLRAALISLTSGPRSAHDSTPTPGLAAELDVTLCRMNRQGVQGGGKNPERPLPLNLHLSKVITALRQTIVTWTLLVAEEMPDTPPADTLEAMAHWLACRIRWIARHPAAAEAMDEILGAIEPCEHAIDNREDKWFAGPCDGAECPADLYGLPGAVDITCRVCGTVYDSAARKTWMLEQANDLLATATEISRLMTKFGQPVSVQTIGRWRDRQALAVTIDARTGEQLYRVAHVVALIGATPPGRPPRRTKHNPTPPLSGADPVATSGGPDSLQLIGSQRQAESFSARVG